MAEQCNSISNLVNVLREDGDKILNATSRLTLSTSLLKSINETFRNVLKSHDTFSSFLVLNTSTSFLGNCLDLQILYDFIQKTLALKLLPGHNVKECDRVVNIELFHSLKLLEINRISLKCIKGLKYLRTQLEHLTCSRNLHTLNEVLENCGLDHSSGSIWGKLKEATFSHNDLKSIGGSFKFTPWLHTLDLSHNMIRDASPLSCLPNLKYLNLSYNQLESVPTFIGQLCEHLHVLVLCSNYIEDIRQISVLTSLSELDLSDNCILDHSMLAPVGNLVNLQWFSLEGNPISFHPHHRLRSVRYFHLNTARELLVFDRHNLSTSEKKLLGSLHQIQTNRERSQLCFVSCDSNQSIVVPVDEESHKKTISASSQSSELTNSAASVTTVLSNNSLSPAQTEIANEETQLHEDSEILLPDCLGMQDSGIVDGRRPVSPSECSIGSASTFTDEHEDQSPVAMKQCESDIEVISNPSQSSIEILSTGPVHLRYVQSTGAMSIRRTEEYRTKTDLRRVKDEQHRSL